ncbi:MAG: porin family protein [Gemmatimonadota bacterium]
MRHGSVVTALLVAMASPAPAQRPASVVGLQFGVNSTNLASDTEDATTRSGVMLGAAVDIAVSRHFAVRPEITYTLKGADTYVTVPQGPQQVRVPVGIRLAYIEVPVFAKVMVPLPRSPVKPYLMAGPAVGFKASCKLESDILLSTDRDCQTEGKVKNVDLGAAAGIGIDAPLGQTIVTLGLRYTLGLTSIDHGDGTFDFKNRALTVHVGVGFPTVR